VLLVEVLVVVGVLSTVAVVVAGRGGAMAPVVPDRNDIRIPPEEVMMDPADIDALRFGLAFRGYRMDQVDEALDRLREELQARDERIAELTRHLGSATAPTPPAAPDPPDPPAPPVTEAPGWSDEVAAAAPADDPVEPAAVTVDDPVEPAAVDPAAVEPDAEPDASPGSLEPLESLESPEPDEPMSGIEPNGGISRLRRTSEPG
jgi:DivIVA domain-containing protein